MLSLEQFENNVYKAVTKELNLLVAQNPLTQREQIQLHHGVLKVLHYVTQETMTQILCGIVYNLGGVKDGK